MCWYGVVVVESIKMSVKNCIVKLQDPCFSGTSSPCYNDVEMLTEFNWDDCNIRRVFIRKVNALSLH